MNLRIHLQAKLFLVVTLLYFFYLPNANADVDCRSKANKYAESERVKLAKKANEDASLIQAGVTSNFIPANSTPDAIGKDKEEYEVEVILGDKEHTTCYAVQVMKTTCQRIAVRTISCVGD